MLKLKKFKKSKHTKQFYKRLIGILLIIICCTVLINAFKARSLTSSFTVLSRLTGQTSSTSTSATIVKPSITEDLLTPNKYSRPQTKLKKVNSIVIHYVGNPGSTAQANRDYFESLAESGDTSASSHFVVGTDGTIIQCIPLNEISYASNNRNSDTISIEVCHPKVDGKFTTDTCNALTKLVAWLLDTYDLSKDDIIRHYDVTGKICPKYYVDHEDAWEKLKTQVWDYYQKNK
ncbi:MAG: peptidoglycan recognition family protein [bacterium]|nr:peptidoglycan recognition family protein [bacterium]